MAYYLIHRCAMPSHEGLEDFTFVSNYEKGFMLIVRAFALLKILIF